MELIRLEAKGKIATYTEAGWQCPDPVVKKCLENITDRESGYDPNPYQTIADRIARLLPVKILSVIQLPNRPDVVY